MSIHSNQLAHSNARRCSALQKFHQFFSVFVQVIVGSTFPGPSEIDYIDICMLPPCSTVIMILRTYALFERNARIGWIMALFASLVIAVGVVCRSRASFSGTMRLY